MGAILSLLLNEQTGAWGLEPEIPAQDVPLVTTEKAYQERAEHTRRRRDIILRLITERRAYRHLGHHTTVRGARR